MILLLGKDEYIKQYAVQVLNINPEIIHYCPQITTHYSEYHNKLDNIKNEHPTIIASQNIEFIKYLLNSDLDFEVRTIYEDLYARRLPKEKAVEVYQDMGLEIR